MKININYKQKPTEILLEKGIKEIYCVTESGCVDDNYFTTLEEAQNCAKEMKDPELNKLKYNQQTEEFEVEEE